MRRKTSPKNLISKIYRDPNFKGKHIIIIGGKIYFIKTGKAKSELLNKLLKKYPEETPIITYIPKADSLILFPNLSPILVNK